MPAPTYIGSNLEILDTQILASKPGGRRRLVDWMKADDLRQEWSHVPRNMSRFWQVDLSILVGSPEFSRRWRPKIGEVAGARINAQAMRRKVIYDVISRTKASPSLKFIPEMGPKCIVHPTKKN
ncbi:hypothetical protein B0H14DRAFT_3140900 [Mycena olivaceomarginata]|nr:hypothetical protein B0H14DRAFT_3140900 [Mycena olivaceomarginata]